jgi:hypothetical protein
MTLQILNATNFTPFASFIAMRAKVPTPDKDQFVQDISAALIPPQGWKDVRVMPQPATTGMQPEFVVALTEERPISWDKTWDLEDTLHHLLVGFCESDFALVYVSDSQLKLRLQEALIQGDISNWHCVEQDVLNTAFLFNNKLRTLWLGATHRSIDVRPNTKVISGSNVREAVEPFGDATFMPSAARSEMAGVSLKRSNIWRGGKGNWDAFCTNGSVLINAMRNAVLLGNLTHEVHPALASWCASFVGVSGAYDVCIADAEAFDPEAPILNRLEELKDFQIKLLSRPAGSTQPHEAVFLQLLQESSNLTAEVVITPRIEKERVKFRVDWLNVGVKDVRDRFNKIIEPNSELLRIYYNTGHTITGASLSKSVVQDNEFTHFVDGDFSMPASKNRYNIMKEKPSGPNMTFWVTKMSQKSDQSLFSWVRRLGITQLGLAQLATGQTWLYCDDGSGEIADFLHVHIPQNATPRITAIHVKGAHSCSPNREISVSAFEVVAGQAIKNLRQILAQTIMAKVTDAIAKTSTPRVWDAAWPAKSTLTAQTTLQAALANIGAQCDYEVVIVQPHIRRAFYNANINSVPAKKLRTLLFGALAMARSSDATFRVVIDDK